VPSLVPQVKALLAAVEAVSAQGRTGQKSARGDLRGKENLKMEVLEKSVTGKISPEACEDAVFVSDHFAAVVDGVTSKSDFRYQGKTTGKLAAEMITDVLAGLSGTENAREIIRKINQKFARFYEEVPFPYNVREKGLQAVCVIYSEYFQQVWMIGDCQAAVDGQEYYNPKKSDVVLSEMRSLALHVAAAEGSSPLPMGDARALIEPWLLKSTVFANREDSPYGYAVINGEEIPSSLIRVIPIPEGRHEIVLTSDGYPRALGTLQASEDYLAEILLKDPGCDEIFLSTKGLAAGQKSFDDRSYLRLSVC
jgi:hypothetical protein